MGPGAGKGSWLAGECGAGWGYWGAACSYDCVGGEGSGGRD